MARFPGVFIHHETRNVYGLHARSFDFAQFADQPHIPSGIHRAGEIPVAAVVGEHHSVDFQGLENHLRLWAEAADIEVLPQAEALAKAIGGEMAASRPICDEGWLPMERQIGSSGQTVAPKLYLALGISGAIQHVVGMKGARTIVAINKDQNAPIFEIADYGIVGDIFEIMPALTAALEKAKT